MANKGGMACSLVCIRCGMDAWDAACGLLTILKNGVVQGFLRFVKVGKWEESRNFALKIMHKINNYGRVY